MKKFVLTFALIGSLFLDTYAQSIVYLDTNNVRALIPSTPLLFWDGNQINSYRVPKSGTSNSIFTSTPWIGGVVDGELHLAAETYRQAGVDFQSGPVATNYVNLSKWNVVKVTRAEIEAFIANPSSWSTPPASFLKWPAHGDTLNGEAFQLAPFVNVGGDPFVYEPTLGDYPKIKGDMCAYYIFNDDLQHTETNGIAIGVEVHRMVYSFADTNSFLNNSVFVDYKIINRSTLDYTDFIFSVYSDFDLGKYDDDAVGTDSTRNMVYVYNGDANDEGYYGTNPPAQALVILNKPLNNSMYFNNDFTVTGNPDSAANYYNYMQSQWIDSLDLTYGGNGRGGSVAAKFAFSGNPCAPVGWTENSASIAPGDRRMIASIPRFNLNSGESVDITYANIYARGNSGATSSVCALQTEADKLIVWYNNGGTNSIGNEIHKRGPLVFMYPNPSAGSVQVSSNSRLESVTLTDISGKIVRSYNQPGSGVTISDLLPGMYFVEATDANGKTVKKLLVQ